MTNRNRGFLLPSLLLVSLCMYAQQQEDFLIRQEISSLAILPPIGEAVPNHARQMSAELFSAKLKARSTAVRLVSPDETAARLQEGGSTGEYGVFINLLAQTGMVNTEALKRIGQAVGMDALLLIYVLNYEEQKGSWWYGKGGKNLRRTQYTLFRASTGEKLWGSLEFRQHDSKVSTNPYPMERVVGVVLPAKTGQEISV